MRTLLITAAWSCMSILTSVTATAQLFFENFEVDPTAQWTVNNGPSDAATDFFFDYGTIGIPLAPNSASGGNHGLKLQANQTNAVFSGVSVSPNGQDFPGDFTLQFDWWSNFNGPFPAGGSGSTQMSTFGVGTSGNVVQWPSGTQDSIWFAATGDGNSSSDWRAYSPTAPSRYVDTAPGIYAAGAINGSTNASDPYYAGFGTNSAPPAQLSLFPQQTGTTLVGSAAMEWHQVTLERSGGNVTWTVDGTLIATVPVADDTTFSGDNIFFGHTDTNATSSTDPNDGALLFTLIDNVRVVPEPGAGLLLLFGALHAAVARRRRHSSSAPPFLPERGAK
ncbi:MAG TPA: PEP-CTERM sorting domain-containing protein [Chthoniobacteraceae bacterium]|nr:PEP-CTERM sorting domain-containing protein [Chthoniobacteraceae bacterium]